MLFEKIDDLLENNKDVILSIAPTYKIAYKENSLKVLNAVKALNIPIISETINGYYIIIDKVKNQLEYRDYLISEACPVIKNLIINKFPKLSKCLDGCCSPLTNHCSSLKEKYGNDVAIIFVGPCKNKLKEAIRDKSADICLTFQQLVDYLEYKNLLKSSKEEAFNFADTLENVQKDLNIISVDGYKNVINYLNQINDNKIMPKGYLMLYSCEEGCVGRTKKISINFNQ
ncbi:MAG: [Fe-Fe] hydrogenase large subunit C-terminal domain-containing protein [Pleomorphochaeta sp.]